VRALSAPDQMEAVLGETERFVGGIEKNKVQGGGV
jgi:hypothetical protein